MTFSTIRIDQNPQKLSGIFSAKRAEHLPDSSFDQVKKSAEFTVVPEGEVLPVDKNSLVEIAAPDKIINRFYAHSKAEFKGPGVVRVRPYDRTRLPSQIRNAFDIVWNGAGQLTVAMGVFVTPFAVLASMAKQDPSVLVAFFIIFAGLNAFVLYLVFLSVMSRSKPQKTKYKSDPMIVPDKAP